MDASIRQFCANANARLLACADFDEKRQFLVDHVERVIYKGYKVTVMGSVPVQTASGEIKLQFRIKGEIDEVAVQRNGQRFRKEARRSSAPVSFRIEDELEDTVSDDARPAVKEVALSSV